MGVSSYRNINNDAWKSFRGYLNDYAGVEVEHLFRADQKLDRDTISIASNLATQGAMSDFSSAWEAMTPAERNKIRADYIETPFAGGSSAYSETHNRIHDQFLRLLNTHTYYDFFMITTKGDVAYTVAKEVDFGASLFSPSLRDSGLAKVFRAALKSGTDGAVFHNDFAAHGPSNGKISSFAATPILDRNGKILGVFAIQAGLEFSRSQLGQWSKAKSSYLVGPDRRIRATSGDNDDLKPILYTLRTAAVDKALAGETGYLIEDDFMSGRKSYFRYQPIRMLDEKWALLVGMPVDEIEGLAARSVRGQMEIMALIVMLASLFGVVLSRRLTSPLLKLTSLMRAFSKDPSTKLEGKIFERSDEIGQLGKSIREGAALIRQRYESFQNKILMHAHESENKTNHLQSVLDNSADGIVTFGEDGKLESVNRAICEIFGYQESELIGRPVDFLF